MIHILYRESARDVAVFLTAAKNGSKWTIAASNVVYI